MVERAMHAATIATAIGAGLTAGIFLAFSCFIMAALGRIEPRSGIAAMQAINVAVINPLFMLVFMGTGVVAIGLAAGALAGWSGGQGMLLLAASGLYVVGCVGVTMALNVPLNNALAAVAADSDAGAELWARYLRDWTFWNHVRTLASLAASILFVVVLTRASAA